MQISIELCLSDLESYKSGDMIFRSHLAEEFDTLEKVGDHFEYHGHRLTVDYTNYSALKSVFINKLIQNIRDRFPAKSLIDSFFVLAMRTINFEKDLMNYGTAEIECLQHYGEKQVHSDKDRVRSQWKEVKVVVHSAKYPVDDMLTLWKLIATHHYESLSEIIKMAQIALLLPLHTAGCECVFSHQNLILTKQRNRLSPNILDKFLRVKLEGSSISLDDALKHFKDVKQRRKKIKN